MRTYLLASQVYAGCVDERAYAFMYVYVVSVYLKGCREQIKSHMRAGYRT